MPVNIGKNSMTLIRTKFKGPSRFCYYYLITNLLTGRRYVGSRTVNGKNPLEDTGYMGSSVPLCNDIKKYGIENFSKIILRHERFVDKETLCLHESKYMNQYQTLRPNGYNQYDPGKYPGFNPSGIKLTDAVRKRIGENNGMHRTGVRSKVSASLKVTLNRPEVRAKMSASQKINQNRPEVRAKKSKSIREALNRPDAKNKPRLSIVEWHRRLLASLGE